MIDGRSNAFVQRQHEYGSTDHTQYTTSSPAFSISCGILYRSHRTIPEVSHILFKFCFNPSEGQHWQWRSSLLRLGPCSLHMWSSSHLSEGEMQKYLGRDMAMPDPRKTPVICIIVWWAKAIEWHITIQCTLVHKGKYMSFDVNWRSWDVFTSHADVRLAFYPEIFVRHKGPSASRPPTWPSHRHRRQQSFSKFSQSVTATSPPFV